MRSSFIRPVALFGVYASLSSPAFAYLDAATGSIIIQAVIGAVATWIRYSKMFAAKAKAFFIRVAKGRGAQETE